MSPSRLLDPSPTLALALVLALALALLLTLTLTPTPTPAPTPTPTPTPTPPFHQVVIHYDASVLLAQGFSEGLGGGAGAHAAFSGVTVTLNDPVDQALLVGDKDGASAPSGRVQLL